MASTRVPASSSVSRSRGAPSTLMATTERSPAYQAVPVVPASMVVACPSMTRSKVGTVAPRVGVFEGAGVPALGINGDSTR